MASFQRALARRPGGRRRARGRAPPAAYMESSLHMESGLHAERALHAGRASVVRLGRERRGLASGVSVFSPHPAVPAGSLREYMVQKSDSFADSASVLTNTGSLAAPAPRVGAL
eukprot:2579640-Prymnesium_polylepis.1